MKKQILVNAAAVMVAAVLAYLLGARNTNQPCQRSEVSPSQPVYQPPQERHQTKVQSIKYRELPKGQPAAEMTRARTYLIGAKAKGYKSDFLLIAQQLQGMSLTTAQVEEIQDIYSAIYEARINYEVAHAMVAGGGEDERIIEIPSYSFGSELKAMLFESTESVVGSDKAAGVVKQLGDYMDSSNDYFGKYAQTIRILKEPASGVYHIKHSYYTVDGRNELAAERESNASEENLNKYLPYVKLHP